MSKSRKQFVTRLRVASLSLAFSTLASPLLAQDFGQLDKDYKGQVRPRAQIVFPGDEVELAGTGFKPGQKVTLQRGTQLFKTGPYVADDKGEFTAKLTVPANATFGIHPIVVIADAPDSAAIVDLKISQNLPQFGAEKFDIVSKKLVPGLYQVAYGSASDSLFVTTAVGRQATPSALVKVDPKTLEVVAQVGATETTDGGRQGLHAVYGVGTDDANGNVWATNTRTGSISVFKQSDLSLVKQFENEVVPHGRDIVISQKNGKAYAAANNGTIVVFDAKTLEQLPSIELQSGKRGEKFVPMSLQLDDASGKLVTVSLGSSEAAVIDVNTKTVDKVIDLPNTKSAIGVALDAANNRLYVVSQGSDNLLIVDVASGEVLHDVNVGSGPLNVAFEPDSKLAYVSVRSAGTIVVVNGEGKIEAVLDGGSNPNHLSTDGKGNVFAVNKSRGPNDATADHIRKISLKK